QPARFVTEPSATIDGSFVGWAGPAAGTPLLLGAIKGAMNCTPTCGKSVPRSRELRIVLTFIALISCSGLSTQHAGVASAEPTGSVPIEVFAGGLVNPRGLAFGPDGSLYVAEAGTGGPRLVELGREKPHAVGRGGRLSRLTPTGERTTVVDNLPSIVTAANEEVGPSGLAFLGDQLYLLTAS